MSGSSIDERGQTAPFLVLLALAIGLACLGLGRFAAGAVDLAQARTAADAAALAGAAEGDHAARALADANGAVLSRFEAAAGGVRAEATVVSGPRWAGAAPGPPGASARARARLDEARRPEEPAPDEPAQDATRAMRAALDRAESVLGEHLADTFDHRGMSRGRIGPPVGPPAEPGLAAHLHGSAVDVAPAMAVRLALVQLRTGLCQPYPRVHPAHFEICPPVGRGRPSG